MKQVFIICEGFTEKAFVTEILAREILGKPLHAVFPGKAFNRAQGGDIRYARVRPDIIATIKSHKDNYCTTFIDYYALGGDSPRVPAGTPPKTPGEKAALIERAVEADIATELGNSYNPRVSRPTCRCTSSRGFCSAIPRRWPRPSMFQRWNPTFAGSARILRPLSTSTMTLRRHRPSA